MKSTAFRPVLLWSPLNDGTLPWLSELDAALTTRGCQLVLLTTDPRPAACQFPTIHVPFCLPEYPSCYPGTNRSSDLSADLARSVAERSRAWWGQPADSLDAHSFAVQAAANLFARLLRRLEPACLLTWGSTLPQSVMLQHLAERQRIPSFVLERGLFAGTLMLDQRGHGGRSDLNTFLAAPAVAESSLNLAAYQEAREFFLNTNEVKYPQAPRLSPAEFRKRHAPAARRIVTFFGQWDVASGLLPENSGDARLQSPAFATTAAGLLALQEVVQREPGTALLFKPHPFDQTQYESWLRPETVLLRDANLQALFTVSDVTAFMLSTVQFEALLHEKPCVLLSRSQLWGKGVGYEVETAAQLSSVLREAFAAKDLDQRCERQRAWLGGVLRNYLIRTRPEVPAGRSLADLASFVAANSLPASIGIGVPERLATLQQELSARTELSHSPNSANEMIPPAASLSARLIAFYLPQFHPIPENDRWWGRGFTEWTNVSKALPRFPEHYQPHLPGEMGFYDLRLADVRAEQANLARAHGIEGFCYWHYWFNGKQLLERPVEDMLVSGQPDFPFCLAWANENWTRRWDGNDREMLQAQTYGGEADDRAHFQTLLPAFRDSRAIRVAGRLLFLVYRPANLPDAPATIRLWRELAAEAGLPGLYLVAMRTCFDGQDRDWRKASFDAELYFQPDFSDAMQKEATTVGLTKDRVVSYAQAWRAMSAGAEAYVAQRNAFPSVVPSWDNSARRKEGAFIIHSSTPAEYARWLRKEIRGVQSRPRDARLVFLNAWNEWAEGNHLEPDQRWGRAYLEETRNANAGDAAKGWSILATASNEVVRRSLDSARATNYALRQGNGQPRGPHELELLPAGNRAEFIELYRSRLAESLRLQEQLHPGTKESVLLPGFCAVCGKEQSFLTDLLYSRTDDHGRIQPCWRERQICSCGLNSRMRACFHLLVEKLGLSENAFVYCTEQTTALFRQIRERFPFAIGSEFFGDQVPLGGQDSRGLRNEDITRLTFPDDSFDCIFSLEVLEHVPDYVAGLGELARCTKPGGKLLLTTPIYFNYENTVVRASVSSNGELIHHQPPIYHGDPINSEGALCFNDFGWDLLQQLREAGFADAMPYFFTSKEYGYLGLQCVILATRDVVLKNRSTRRARPQVTAKPPQRQVRPQKPIEATDILQQRAAAQFAARDWAGAGEAYLTLSSRLPDDLAVWQARLECARQQGHAVMADLILEEALDRHPEWAAALNDVVKSSPAPVSAAVMPVADAAPLPANPVNPTASCVETSVSNRMKREWNERAAENARYYVRSSTRDQSEEEFDSSGEQSAQQCLIQGLPEFIGNRNPQSMTMLEIGCGVGRMTKHFARHFRHVHAIDVSGEMIRQARGRLGSVANISLHETSGSDLSLFADGQFDLVFSYIVFQHIPDRAVIFNYIREAHRVLQPGGVFRFQVQGCTQEDWMAAPKDTWHGVTITETDVDDLRAELGFDLLAKSGQGTQYSWYTLRKHTAQPRQLTPAPRRETVDDLLKRAQQLCATSNWVEAGEIYLSLSNSRPDDITVWRGRIECARQQGHTVMADLLLEEALEKHPEWAAQLGAHQKTATATLVCH